MNFNPRSRTGSDEHLTGYTTGSFISTHAPAQGATEHLTGYTTGSFISTHAPAQGATPTPKQKKQTQPFQPTLPHRERQTSVRLPGWEGKISTHAPAQGAT